MFFWQPSFGPAWIYQIKLCFLGLGGMLYAVCVRDQALQGAETTSCVYVQKQQVELNAASLSLL